MAVEPGQVRAGIAGRRGRGRLHGRVAGVSSAGQAPGLRRHRLDGDRRQRRGRLHLGHPAAEEGDGAGLRHDGSGLPSDRQVAGGGDASGRDRHLGRRHLGAADRTGRPQGRRQLCGLQPGWSLAGLRRRRSPHSHLGRDYARAAGAAGTGHAGQGAVLLAGQPLPVTPATATPPATSSKCRGSWKIELSYPSPPPGGGFAVTPCASPLSRGPR